MSEKLFNGWIMPVARSRERLSNDINQPALFPGRPHRTHSNQSRQGVYGRERDAKTCGKSSTDELPSARRGRGINAKGRHPCEPSMGKIDQNYTRPASRVYGFWASNVSRSPYDVFGFGLAVGGRMPFIRRYIASWA